jgi:hypothetical protein
MPELWYMSRDEKGIFYSGWDAERVYDSYQNSHLNPGSGKYGAVLKSTKRVHTAWTIKVTIHFRPWVGYGWNWKPDIRWKHGEYRFHWLCFFSWLEPNFTTVDTVIVRDHLKELQN